MLLLPLSANTCHYGLILLSLDYYWLMFHLLWLNWSFLHPWKVEICSICSSLANNILNHMPCHPSITAQTLNEYNYPLAHSDRATKMSWTPPSLCCVAILFPCQMDSFDKSPFSQPFCIFSSLSHHFTSYCTVNRNPQTAMFSTLCHKLPAISWAPPPDQSSCSFSTVTVEEVPFSCLSTGISVPHSLLPPQETWSPYVFSLSFWLGL